jgi:predicted MFS family arabinose efflux permease
MILGQMKAYPLICIFTYLLSFVNEAFRPANSTAMAFYSKTENRTRSYALNRLAINLGWALGSGLGGFLAHKNYELLFWVDGGTNIIAAMLMFFLLRPVNYKPAPIKDGLIITQSALRDKSYMIFIVITMLFASCFFQLFTNLPVYFKKNLHLSEPFIGVLMAFNGIIIALVEMVLIYKLEGKRRSITYISAGVFIVGISFLTLNIPGASTLVACNMIVIVSVGEILSMPFMNSYWIAKTNNTNRGQYAALYTMAWSAAQTIGPMGGAQLADYAGFNVLWWTVGCLSVIAAFMFRRFNK